MNRLRKLLNTLSHSKSKVVLPLIAAFLALISMAVLVWLANLYMSQRAYSVLEQYAATSEKMLVITNLIEAAHSRTRLTGQMLVTEDIFERDEITQKLNELATRFAVGRLALLAMPLSEAERTALEQQYQVISRILPRQRMAADWAMSDEPELMEKARQMLYQDVIPGQEILMQHFLDILEHMKQAVETSSSQMQETKKTTILVNIVLMALVLFGTLVVAVVTIRRIRHIEMYLHDANIELTRLNNVKNDFVSLVSHELRTPLTSIKSFAEILIDDIEDMDIETQKRYLGIIDKEGDRLSRLVSNILDLQKIDANKMVWHDAIVDLNEVVSESANTFVGAYQTKGLTLDILTQQDSLKVYADTDKLKQVIANLLSNALKFTEQGRVQIRVEPADSGNADATVTKWVRVAVQDTGMGIAPEQQDKVFDCFHQVDNSQTRKSGGTGLGLDICRKIINHYEGDIRVESEVDVGSTFYFELPLAHSVQQEQTPSLPRSGSPGREGLVSTTA